jgi:hypothetical protein
MASQDWELDQFIAAHIMQAQGSPPYTANISEAWKVVEQMLRQYYCELKLDVFLGVTGQRWIASFYSPSQCRRYEAQGGSAPLAICRAAKEAFLNQGGR